MADIVPPHLMNPERLAISRDFGIASARAYDAKPERDFAAEERAAAGIVDSPPPMAVVQATPYVVASPPTTLKIVGQVITGRQWIVCQLPDGRVRTSLDTELSAWQEAERLATEESGEFAVFQPRGIARPQTTVTKELL